MAISSKAVLLFEQTITTPSCSIPLLPCIGIHTCEVARPAAGLFVAAESFLTAQGCAALLRPDKRGLLSCNPLETIRFETWAGQ